MNCNNDTIVFVNTIEFADTNFIWIQIIFINILDSIDLHHELNTIVLDTNQMY